MTTQSIPTSQAFPPQGWLNPELVLSLYLLCTRTLTTVVTLSLIHSSLPSTGGQWYCTPHAGSPVLTRGEEVQHEACWLCPCSHSLVCGWPLPQGPAAGASSAPVSWRFPQLFCWSGCLELGDTTGIEELWQLLAAQDLAPGCCLWHMTSQCWHHNDRTQLWFWCYSALSAHPHQGHSFHWL